MHQTIGAFHKGVYYERFSLHKHQDDIDSLLVSNISENYN